jgi:hypothetical protein
VAGVLLLLSFQPWSTSPEAALGGKAPSLHLRLDETTGSTADDASGNGRTGKLLGLGDGPTRTAGRMGGGLRFNRATNDRVRIAGFPYAPANAFTVAFWFKAEDVSGTGAQYLFSQGATSYPHHVNVTLFESGSASAGVLRTMLRDADDSVSFGALDVAGKVTTGRWHHYALTVTPGEGSRVYIDGVQQAASKRGGDAFRPNGDIGLGCRLYGADGAQHFGGCLDDVRIYSSALIAEEIAALARP